MVYGWGRYIDKVDKAASRAPEADGGSSRVSKRNSKAAVKGQVSYDV
jgi:hypothetical protein